MPNALYQVTYLCPSQGAMLPRILYQGPDAEKAEDTYGHVSVALDAWESVTLHVDGECVACATANGAGEVTESRK